MPDGLIEERAVDGPATHAIVIGVGAYPHLVGGDGPLTDDHEGMGQLSSPPASARAVADWLISRHNLPTARLATVALLLSEAEPDRYVNPRTGDEHAVMEATADNVEAALTAWKQRGDTDPGNHLVFYFCGHGIAHGPDVSLLLRDFGADPNRSLHGALDLGSFHPGMDRCAARRQVWFVDACRASSDTLIGAGRYQGRVPVQPRPPQPGGPGREAPVYYSTLAGHDAYGRPGGRTPFTDALLKGLDGAGGDDSEGDWRVDTTRLKLAIDWFMRQAVEAGATPVQVPVTGNLTTFFFHHIEGTPSVPVYVHCQPDQANERARLRCLVDADREFSHRDPAAGDWVLDLPAGTYRFVAEWDDDAFHAEPVDRSVGPVYDKVLLQVAP